MLALIVPICCAISWVSWLFTNGRHQEGVAKWVETSGGYVTYGDPYFPRVLTSELSEQYGRPISSVVLFRSSGADLKMLSRLSDLEVLILGGQNIETLEHISSLTSLRHFRLDSVRGLDMSPLCRLKSLKFVTLRDSSDIDRGSIDFDSLERIGSLEGLVIDIAHFHDVAQLRRFSRLEALSLYSVDNFTAEPLLNLANLRILDLRGTRVADKDLSTLKNRLPDCKIIVGPAFRD
jgi:hypothetical protein